MIEVAVTPSMYRAAKQRFEFGALRASITKGGGNLAGALGELAYIEWLTKRGYRVEDTSTYDYDIIVNGFKVDVKTKRINNKPADNYRVAVASANTTQKCDFYFFAYCLYNTNKVYLSGYCAKAQYFEKASFRKQGMADPHGDNPNYKFAADCYIMKHTSLNKFKTFG